MRDFVYGWRKAGDGLEPFLKNHSRYRGIGCEEMDVTVKLLSLHPILLVNSIIKC